MFGIGGTPVIEIKFDGVETRKKVAVKSRDGKVEKLPLYTGEDDISGTVDIYLNKMKKLDHSGIKVELIGRIECSTDSKLSSDFTQMGRELEPIGSLSSDKSYKFNFNRFEKLYETYSGITMSLKYFIRITIVRQYAAKITKEADFCVYLPTSETPALSPIKNEVGIEECLHLEFEYSKNAFHLKDCVIGKVNFMLVRIKIKYMELAIVRKETVGQANNSNTESESLAKYEIMDGCPSKGQVIPIRMYLNAYDLTPTMANISGKFSVKYFINIVLVDEEDRRYFKHQEITVYRKNKS